MIQIEPLNDDYEISSIILQPKLWKMTYGQGCLVEEFEIDKTCNYLGVIYQNELAGMFQLKEFNKITVDAHIYILPKYQNGLLSLKAVKACKEYLQENSDIYKVITSVPYECHYVHKFLAKTEFKPCGLINNGIIYNNNLQDLILYQLTIKEGV